MSPSAPYAKTRSHPAHVNGAAANTYPVRTNSSGHGPNVADRSLGNHQYEPENSPPNSYLNRSASLGNRKRAYEERYSSEDSEEEARRQEDDITPKLKRRQPKVAEAYR